MHSAPLTTLIRAREVGITTLIEAVALLCLLESGPMRIGELALALDVPFSSMSRVTWSLKLLGLVEYRPHDHDRRVHEVVPTKAAQKVLG